MFKKEKILNSNLPKYEAIIPEVYHDRIRFGDVSAIAVHDLMPEGDWILYAIYITRRLDKWLEIVWIEFSDKSISMVLKAEFVRYCIRQERMKYPDLAGAFLELFSDEAGEDFSQMFGLAGMEVTVEKDNIYEFSLSGIKGRDILTKAAGKLPAIPIKDVPGRDRRIMEDMIMEDDRPVPAPLVIDWSSFHQDLSLMCYDKNHTPCGLVLTMEEGDYLVIELAYTDKKAASALAVMLGDLYTKAVKLYGEEKSILVPVVVNKTAEIVEKLVPDAKRGNVIEGVKWF